MEGILFMSQVGASLVGGLLLFLAACAFVLLGYLSGEEVERGRIFWAEWPITETLMAKEAPKKKAHKAA